MSVGVGRTVLRARHSSPGRGYARVGVVVVSPFSHVCGEIPAGVGECQAVLCDSRVRRLVCMPLDALQKVSMGGWHVYFEQI